MDVDAARADVAARGGAAVGARVVSDGGEISTDV